MKEEHLLRNILWFPSDKDNAVIEVVKKAEDSDAVIVRLYECYNRRTPVTLIFGKELTSVVEGII